MSESKERDRCRVGQIRPSQVLWSYGPGAVIDLPNLSVVTLGLDAWNVYLQYQRTLDEPRLLEAARRALGANVTSLRTPPIVGKEILDLRSPEAFVGLPVEPFPRWLRCVNCGLLAEYESGLFELKEYPQRPEQTRFVHVNCPNSHRGNAEAVPARFLLACKRGHLDDFPWRWFVHGGKSECKGTLRFFERKASLQTENLFVVCDGCGQARPLMTAFGPRAAEFLPACRGRHIHLGTFEPCDEQPRAVTLGASNVWFPVTVSALSVPCAANDLQEAIKRRWEWLRDCELLTDVEFVLRKIRKEDPEDPLLKRSALEIFNALRRQETTEIVSEASDVDVKEPEWEVLAADDERLEFPNFLAKRTPPPERYKDKIADVKLLERLRKVNALIGFTRIEPINEFADSEDRPTQAKLSTNQTWIPACEVHGEGIFIRFSEEKLQEWEARPGVQNRDKELSKGAEGWNNRRKLKASRGYPGARYVMLHTLAHLIIRELSLECGYNAASIQERVYAKADPNVPMAGILLYTAASDSDGTLGGLVDLGKAASLERILELALRRAKICSSDPLCARRRPEEESALHGAACHSCAFVSETSCEAGNRYLDRALLVKTFDREDAAFFGDQA